MRCAKYNKWHAKLARSVTKYYLKENATKENKTDTEWDNIDTCGPDSVIGLSL